jgi:acetyl-CoA carboxylase/biotin carboxylase 1
LERFFRRTKVIFKLINRDMFFEILKFGSYIVDGLTEYKKPIFIYLPPFSELRGGAWVVVDPTINLKMMEFYSDENARGNNFVKT